MRLRTLLLALTLTVGIALVGCSSDDDDTADTDDTGTTTTEAAAAETTSGASSPTTTAPAEADDAHVGDGWSAVFPGEVVTQSDPIAITGLEEPLTQETTAWENPTSALLVSYTDVPADIMESADPVVFLDQAALGNGAEIIEGSELLGPNDTFLGNPAVVYGLEEEGFVLNGLATLDGNRLYQLLRAGEAADDEAFASFVASFELTD